MGLPYFFFKFLLRLLTTSWWSFKKIYLVRHKYLNGKFVKHLSFDIWCPQTSIKMIRNKCWVCPCQNWPYIFTWGSNVFLTTEIYQKWIFLLNSPFKPMKGINFKIFLKIVQVCTSFRIADIFSILHSQ